MSSCSSSATSPFGFRLEEVARNHPHAAPCAHAARRREPAWPRQPAWRGRAGRRVCDVARLSRRPLDDAARVIVIDGDAPVGFVVDRIERLADVPLIGIEATRPEPAAVDPDLLHGVVKGAEGESTIKILNPQRLLRGEFDQLALGLARAAAGAIAGGGRTRATAADTAAQSFAAELRPRAQEYALPLDRVREIIQLPAAVAEVARSETAMLGVVTLRDRLLPLVSLRALLGLPPRHWSRARQGRRRSDGHGGVGVVTDRTREILHVDPDAIDPAPALLTRGDGRCGNHSDMPAGARQAARRIALSRSSLPFGCGAQGAVRSSPARRGRRATDGETMADEQFIVFRLGDQEYGLPIASVDEIARPPERLTRMPKAPAFVDGVMNLRGWSSRSSIFASASTSRRRRDGRPTHSRAVGRRTARPGLWSTRFRKC